MSAATSLNSMPNRSLSTTFGPPVAGRKLDKYEARLKAKDGSIKHVLISSNVNFREGQFINTRCFTLDVTE